MRGGIRKQAGLLIRTLERAWGTPKPQKRRPPPLDVLVATILSQHTSDTNSTRAYRELKRRFPRWELAAESSPRAIASAIRSGGLANQKARSIYRILIGYGEKGELRELRRMSDENALAYLLTMEGVGIKTASCVLLFSLGRDVFPVDVHVHRVLTRVGLAKGSRGPEETFERMASSIPPGKSYSLHVNLVKLGRSFCRPTAPACGRCPLLTMCSFGSRSRSHHPSPQTSNMTRR